MTESLLMLGSTDISGYVSKPYDVSTEERSHIIEKIKQLGGPHGENALSMELAHLDLILGTLAKATYKELNPKFLSMCNVKTMSADYTRPRHDYSLERLHVEEEVKIPKFGIYPFFGENSFKVQFIYSQSDSGIGVAFSNHVPSHFIPHLLTSVGFQSYHEVVEPAENRRFNSDRVNRNYDGVEKEVYVIRWPDIPKDLGISKLVQAGLGRNFFLENHFNGLIPIKTKEKVEEAKQIFREDQIYIISEVQPNEWTEEVIELPGIDPLVVGISSNKTLLIDYFDTTPLEDIVRREFLE